MSVKVLRQVRPARVPNPLGVQDQGGGKREKKRNLPEGPTPKLFATLTKSDGARIVKTHAAREDSTEGEREKKLAGKYREKAQRRLHKKEETRAAVS